ncbi:hypothetical protein HBB16_14865 [Pseudonocardia sp. MCCB 268]|nr:hypothetical protein [Pseudonocardia cytotoxica]
MAPDARRGRAGRQPRRHRGRAGPQLLEPFDLARRSVTAIADPASGFAVSGDGTRIVVRDSGRVRRSDRPQQLRRPDDDAGGDEFRSTPGGAGRHTIDPSAEWRQIIRLRPPA